MKLIIDIDEDRYEDTKRIASVQMNYRAPTIEQIVANGTPLEQEPCEDAISRGDALQIVENVETARLKGDIDLTYPPTIKGLKALPSVQQKIGHWIRVDKDKLKCSKCEVVHFIAQYPQSAKINYCPNCGVRMADKE